MNLNIAVLPGDGIGPEIIEEAKKILLAVAKKYNHTFQFYSRACWCCCHQGNR